MAADRRRLNDVGAEPVVGAVLAGGAGRRFDGDKAAVVGPRVITALRAAGVDPIVAVGGTSGVLGVPTVPDRFPGDGPLGGAATILSWARTGHVLLVPCDLPLLTSTTVRSLVERLATVPAGERADTAVVAAHDGRPQVSVGVWPAGRGSDLVRRVKGGHRRFAELLDSGPYVTVEVPAADLEDADDRDHLDALLRRDHQEARLRRDHLEGRLRRDHLEGRLRRRRIDGDAGSDH